MADDYSINAKINADSSGFAKGIKNAQSSLTSFSKGIASVTKSLMGLFAIQNFGSFIKSIENIATSFDDARSQIVKGTGATGQALENLSKSVENSLRMGVGRSAEEIGTMIADLNTRFGVTGQELEKLVDEFDMFASVTGQDTKTAIESVADVMLKWNVETEQADELLDQLTVASQASGASVEELENGLKGGQTTFKQFGMSVTKSTAFLASLKKNGIDSGTALAGLRVALVNFTKDGRNAETAFKEITEQIKNASTESEALNIAIDTFGSRMGAEMVKIFRDGGESVDEMTKALMGATGALKESDEASRTTKDAFEDLKAVFTSLFAGMNGVGVRDLIDDIAESLKSINIESVRTSIGNFVNELKTLALNVGTIIKTIFDNFKELFTRLSEMLGLSTLTFDDWKESVYEILDNFYRIIQDAFGLIFAILDGDWSLAWEYAKLVVLRTVESVIKSLDEMTDKFKDRLQKILMIAKASSLFLPKTASIALEGALTTLQKITSNTDKERTVLENAIAETEANIESMTGKSADVQLKALERIGKKRATYVRDFEAGEIDIQSAVDNTTEAIENQTERLTDWDKKLLKQKLDDLDEWENEYLTTQIKILEAERQSELKQEHNAEEVYKINLYYNKEIEKAHQKSEEAKRKQVAKTVKKVTDVMKTLATKVTKVILSGIKIATKMLKTAFDVFKKLINFNISDALDILLKFEDSVLSFFVETLPQLPQFVSTVLKSINTMLSSLVNSVKAENIATVIYGILDELANNLPNIVQNILTIIQNMITFSNEHLADIVYEFLKILEENAIPVIEGLLDLLTNVIKDSIDGLYKWLDEGGLKSLLNLALKIQTSVQDVFMKLLTSVADLLENHTGDVTKFISDSLQKAMEDLPKLVDALLRIVNSLIKSVADLFKDKKFVDTMVQSMIDTFNSLMDRLPDIIGSVVDLILSLITALVPKLPEIILAVITKIVETIPKIINEIVGKIGSVISDIFSRIFTAEFWQEVFGKIGEGFQRIFDSLGKGLEEAFTKGGYGKNSTGSTVGDLAVDLLVPFGFLRHFFADGTNNAPSGLAVVGEAGPELVKFRGGEQVINNRNTQKVLAGMNGNTNNFNVTFNNLQDTTAYAMMNQLKQYNRQMAINGVI
jgi:phage-related minor tail protein